jgi:hypothetical protein
MEAFSDAMIGETALGKVAGTDFFCAFTSPDIFDIREHFLSFSSPSR